MADVLVFASRLVEEVKQRCAGVQLQNEDVYMATAFQDFVQMLVRRLRGDDQEEELLVDYVSRSHELRHVREACSSRCLGSRRPETSTT